MKQLKLIGLLTVTVMLLGMLAACGTPATPAAQPTTAPAAPTAAPAAPQATEAPQPTAVPAEAAKKFSVATNAEFAPMEFVNQAKELTGFDIELIKAIAADQKFEIEFQNVAWDGIFAGLEAGQYDAIISSVTITDERKQKYDFSEGYFKSNQAIVVVADNTEVSDGASLTGKRVGVQIATTGAFAVQDLGIDPKEYDGPDMALQDLVNGNLDAVVVDMPVAADYALQAEQFKGKLKITMELPTNETFGAVVQKGDPKAFLPLFNAGLANLKASGEYDKLYEKWFGIKPGAAAPVAEGEEDPCAYGGEIKAIEAVDDLTVKFSLCFPDPAFPAKAADTAMQIWPAEVLEAGATSGGKEWLEKPVGTGPYMLKEWRKGDQLILEANPNYWGEKAKTPTMVFRWSPEAAQRLLELQSGNVNGIDNPGPDDFDVIEGDANLQLMPRAGTNIFYVGMNNVFAPFDNEKVRQAFAMAIDRARIVDNFYPKGSIVATQFMPPSIFGYSESLDWYEYNPEEAIKILTEEGVYDANGKFATKIFYRDVVRGYLPEPGVVAQDIQAQLAEINVDAEIQVMESGAYLDAADAGQLNGFHLLGWGADYPDATNFLDYHFGAGSSKQFGEKFPDLIDALQRAAALADAADRQPIYDEANALVKQHVPMIPVAHGGSATAFQAVCEGAHSSPLTREKMDVIDCGTDTLVFMQNGEPISLYCADETDGETFRPCEQVNEALLSYDVGTTDVVPALAEKFEANEDLTEWIFTLRSGVKFHDGSDLDAGDVVTSWVAQWDAASPMHTGRVGDFTYFQAYFGKFKNAPSE